MKMITLLILLIWWLLIVVNLSYADLFNDGITKDITNVSLSKYTSTSPKNLTINIQTANFSVRLVGSSGIKFYNFTDDTHYTYSETFNLNELDLYLNRNACFGQCSAGDSKLELIYGSSGSVHQLGQNIKWTGLINDEDCNSHNFNRSDVILATNLPADNSVGNFLCLNTTDSELGIVVLYFLESSYSGVYTNFVWKKYLDTSNYQLNFSINSKLALSNTTSFKINETLYFNASNFTSGRNNITFQLNGSHFYRYEIINLTLNIVPNATTVEIINTPILQNEDANGTATYFDADGDTQMANYTIWYINQTRESTADNSFILKGGNASQGANLTFSILFYDGYDNGTWFNSSQATVGDSTPPTLSNWTLQYTNLNDASGNTNQLNVSATDALSNIQSINFDINGSLNATRSFSFTVAQTVTSSYSIFSSQETLKQGVYNITRVGITDSSGNSVNYLLNESFTVSAAPSSGGSSGGSGGGGNIVVVINQTNATVQNCNFNKICEKANGEDAFGCPEDCPLNTNFFTCDDPTQNCISNIFDTRNKTFRFATVLAIGFFIVAFTPVGKNFKRKK